MRVELQRLYISILTGQYAELLTSRGTTQEISMLSVIIGTLMVLSIGILIAHAMDAFRS